MIVEPSREESAIKLSIEEDADLRGVVADRSSTMQVFLNLAMNSERAMNLQPRKELLVKVQASSQNLSVHIIDTGCGVANPDELFKPETQVGRRPNAEMALRDIILQYADALDTDANDIARREGELVLWNDTGSGHQKYPAGKTHLSKDNFNQLLQFPFEFCKRRVSAENCLVFSQDLHLDSGGFTRFAFREQNAGAECAATVIDLGLR